MTTNQPTTTSGAIASATDAPHGVAHPDFASFFRAFFARTVRSVEAIAGSSAEDVAQEAFIAALLDWDRVVSLEAPDAWIRLVAKRIAWRRRHRDIGRREFEASAIPPMPPVHDETLTIDLQVALRGLPAARDLRRPVTFRRSRVCLC